MLQMLCEHPRWADADLSSLRTSSAAARRYRPGSPLPGRGLVLQQGYGMTEAVPGRVPGAARRGDRRRPVRPACRTSSATSAAYGRTCDRAAGAGQGEVLVRGPHVMPGYWGPPEETAAVLTRRLVPHRGRRRVDDDGYVFIVDRIKDMIISGGENIYPAEVEASSPSWPTSSRPPSSACRTTVGRGPRAFVVPRAGADLDEVELRACSPAARQLQDPAKSVAATNCRAPPPASLRTVLREQARRHAPMLTPTRPSRHRPTRPMTTIGLRPADEARPGPRHQRLDRDHPGAHQHRSPTPPATTSGSTSTPSGPSGPVRRPHRPRLPHPLPLHPALHRAARRRGRQHEGQLRPQQGAFPRAGAGRLAGPGDATLADVEEVPARRPGHHRRRHRAEGADKPVCIAQMVHRYYKG